jgi:PAS domain S-box-containing protein
LFIKDMMTTDFVCCSTNHTLREVLPMFTQTHSNMLPVVNKSNQLIGVITKNKIFKVLANQPSFDTTIEHYYSPDPVFLYPTATIEESRQLLLKHKVGHAPVVDGKMTPIGVLSTQQALNTYDMLVNQMETQLRLTKEWEQKLRSVIEFAYDAIILVNKNAEITMVNKGFTDLFGWQSKDVLNKSTSVLFPELGIENVIKSATNIQNMPQIIDGQQSLISILPIRENGDTIGAICKVTYRGLTHLHEALTKVKKLEKQVFAYQTEINEIKGTKYTLLDIAGESDAILKIKREASLAAKSMSTVLIIGESGTGKELFAQGIHAASGQKGTFVQVNCAAVPPELLESEFFGYADGAFTGAKKGGMKGKFELAQNGTIFLDEIGDMSLPLQTKILRVLQEKEFQPIGSSKTIHLNTKIIAATNQNIEQLVKEGRFREDLYYRLNIIRLDIPPLRERLEDLPEIIDRIVYRLNQTGFYIRGITHSAITKLMKHSWPGNVRELQNVLERAANLKTGDYIDSQDIPSFQEFTKENPVAQMKAATYKDIIQLSEREMIVSALKEAKGNKTKASQLLGISRPWLYAKIKKYNL